MKLPKQAKPVMRKVCTVNHFGLGIRPALPMCKPEMQNDLGDCLIQNGGTAVGVNCNDCCQNLGGDYWRGPDDILYACH